MSSDTTDADGRTEIRIPVRLSPTEYSRLVIEAILNNVSVGELLRQHYFEGSRSGQDAPE